MDSENIKRLNLVFLIIDHLANTKIQIDLEKELDWTLDRFNALVEENIYGEQV